MYCEKSAIVFSIILFCNILYCFMCFLFFDMFTNCLPWIILQKNILNFAFFVFKFNIKKKNTTLEANYRHIGFKILFLFGFCFASAHGSKTINTSSSSLRQSRVEIRGPLLHFSPVEVTAEFRWRSRAVRQKSHASTAAFTPWSENACNSVAVIVLDYVNYQWNTCNSRARCDEVLDIFTHVMGSE